MSDTGHIENIREALTAFRHGIRVLEDHLAPDAPDQALTEALTPALETILAMKGRLIVSGMGKSGHIGCKLAATFASTGTPAFFVHPAEASHGDLGMITKDDVVLMLSWSGETRELGDLATYCRRFRVPLISISGNAQSTLAKAANVAIALPKSPEACPHNLAPTTSTLLQLAIGDALAVALLRARGFSEKSFFDFHPGGKLGASLTDVGDIMSKGDDMPLVGQDQVVFDVVSGIWGKNLGIVGITNDAGDLIGVVTDGDLRRYLAESSDTSMQAAMRETKASEIMTADPICLSKDMLAAGALARMQKNKISAAYVLEEGKPVGVLTLLQLLNLGVA
ncbi:KpsF/GutQ family sugar-phosphate isomerase [Thalassobius sp. I31.1]|uniref:KpsF/GutQ family sugar-phosphate isomerase n=1 Tax=Thalassobius sp. I31.1 TaxID=2109912 RepID=UPI000D1B4044|nr:KpsF/GutQ family sugar-phosphate isomerase [Thalassobius sp. I31.1]